MDRLASVTSERDNSKLQKLLRIKQNIENNAKKDAEKYQIMLKKREKRDKLMKEH